MLLQKSLGKTIVPLPRNGTGRRCKLAQQFGQISIEYMLVIAAFLGAAALLMPAAQRMNEAASFSLEAQNAKAFLDRLGLKAGEMQEYADGSCIEVKAMPNLEWLLKNKEGKILLEIRKGENEKVFERQIDAEVGNEIRMASGSRIFLSREGGMLSVKDREC